MHKVAIMGSATIDRIVQTNKTVHKVGGVVTYAGLTFALHGFKPVIISNIGGSEKVIFDLYKKHNFRLFNRETDRTTLFVNDARSDHRQQRVLQVASPIQTHTNRNLLRNIPHIYLGPLHPDDFAIDIFSLPTHAVISLDVQGYVREIYQQRVFPKTSRYLWDLLSICNIIKASEEEMDTILTDYQMQPDELLDYFHLDEIIITKGQNGGSIFTAREKIDYPAQPVTKLVDTTGTGDVFFAAYLIKRVHEKTDIHHASEYASRIAAQQVEGRYIDMEELIV